MINEVIVVGVVAGKNLTSSGLVRLGVVTGAGIESVSGDRQIVHLDVFIDETNVKAGDLVFIRGTMRTQKDVVDGLVIQRTSILASIVDRMVAGPCRLAGSTALTPGGASVQLHNFAHLVGLVVHDLHEKVDGNSVMHKMILATEREFKNGDGRWHKTTDYNKAITWNFRWLPQQVKKNSLVEVDGHIQTRPTPIGNEGQSYHKAEIVAHKVMVRTEWSDRTIQRMALVAAGGDDIE